MEEHKGRYLEAWDQASEQGALGGLAGGVSAMGDLKLMWDDLAEVAPDEIRSDTEAVRDAWREQEEAAKSGDWMGALAGGLLNSGSMGRVDQYVRENCDGQDAAVPAGAARPAGSPGDMGSATSMPSEPTPSPSPADLSGIQDLEHTSWGVVNDVLISVSGLNSSVAEGVGAPTTVYVPSEGAVDIDASQLLPGEDVVSERWTIAGPAANPYAVGKIEVRQAAEGLTPETYRTRLLAVELSADGAHVVQDTEVRSSPCSSNLRLVGSTADAVAFEVTDYEDDVSCMDSSTAIAAWDPQTGEELWSQQAEMESWSYGVVTATYSDPDGQSWDTCLIVSGLDVATGGKLWGIDERDFRQDEYCPGASVDPDVGDGFAANFATKIHVNGDQEFTKRVETRTGQELHIPTNLAHHDPVSGLGVFVGDVDAEEGVPQGLTVLDPLTGETVYTMDLDRFRSLGLQVHGFYDGRLYAGDGNRDLVIDARNGDVLFERQNDDRPDTLGEFAYPVASADTHVLFNNGVLVPTDDVDSYVRNGNAEKTTSAPRTAP